MSTRHIRTFLTAIAPVALFVGPATPEAFASGWCGSRSSSFISVGATFGSGSRHHARSRHHHRPVYNVHHGAHRFHHPPYRASGSSFSIGIGSTHHVSRSTSISTGFGYTVHDNFHRAPRYVAQPHVVFVERPAPQIVYVERPREVVYREAPREVVYREAPRVVVEERRIVQERRVDPPPRTTTSAPAPRKDDARFRADDLDRAWGLLALERPSEAHRLFARTAERDLYDAQPRVGYALASAMRNDDGGAVWAMRRALEFDAAGASVPDDYRLRALMVDLLERYEERASRRLRDPDAHFMSAALRYLLGDLEGALDALNDAHEQGDRANSADLLREAIEAQRTPEQG